MRLSLATSGPATEARFISSQGCVAYSKADSVELYSEISGGNSEDVEVSKHSIFDTPGGLLSIRNQLQLISCCWFVQLQLISNRESNRLAAMLWLSSGNNTHQGPAEAREKGGTRKYFPLQQTTGCQTLRHGRSSGQGDTLA